MLIIFIYYFLSIATLWACYYFRRSRFTEKDYKYNKPLKWTRRILIIWMYLLGTIHCSICFRENLFTDIDNYYIRASAGFFMVAYIFVVLWAEEITHPFNDKK
ncbi:hypothetical protein B5800_11235 [Gilliamella apicola]|nr:hypothetical protein B5800_11235 [Gilliamella apicola]ORF46752.1 hypothetical protein B5803_12870 [Gilliamella apicola]ORF47870.1 hypothetical protein B5799_11040 [Gilliamella apicola]ORF48449.1 hypothetical protein B5802_13445 [Gilliamella apicola]ORF52825.1 hypothetical protein B5798_10835 [Gilliamella apicola]